MTTAAWDGKTLAVDRQMTSGDLKTIGLKLHRLGRYRYAVYAGDFDQCNQMLDWLRASGKRAKKPTPTEASVLLLDTRKRVCVLYENSLTPLAIQAPYAIGSGSGPALAAMLLGHDAKKAIEVASQLDIYTGGGCDFVSLAKTSKACKNQDTPSER